MSQDRKWELLYFQHDEVDGVLLRTTPLIGVKRPDETLLSTVIVRNPYDYFDAMLNDYLITKKSLLFSEEMEAQVKKLDSEAFLRWLEGLHFLPFYNPQIYYLDAKKRLQEATDNLQNFEYVVPYEEVDAFVSHTGIPLKIASAKKSAYPFRMRDVRDESLVEKYIGKDKRLYEEVMRLWREIETHDYRPLAQVMHRMPPMIPLHQAEGYRGGCGGMNAKMVRGFAFKLGRAEPLEVAIYRNKELLVRTKADTPREELQKKFALPSNRCGILVNFEEETIFPGDRIDILIMPEGIKLPISGQAEKYLNGA